MPKALDIGDISGQRFARLTVVGHLSGRGISSWWACRCECGAEKRVCARHLLSGATRSCGCFIRDTFTANNLRRRINGKTHGKHGGPEHRSWNHMLQRCTNPASDAWKDYGGRGIRVCDRWKQFENFYADMGPRPEGKSLDRIDVNGNYEQANCRWATPVEQANNTRRTRRSTR